MWSNDGGWLSIVTRESRLNDLPAYFGPQMQYSMRNDKIELRPGDLLTERWGAVTF